MVFKEDLLLQFPDGFARYNQDPVFRKTIDALCNGTNPISVINSLINLANELQKAVQSYVDSRNHTFTVSFDKLPIEVQQQIKDQLYQSKEH